MAVTQIRGNTQIMAGTITNAEIAAGAAIALSKLAEAVLQADGGQAFTADMPAGGFKITGLGDPTNPQDAATRSWVLTQIAGIPTGATAQEVRTIATTDITLSGTQSINGVALSAGEDVLLTGQTAPEENGPWRVAAGAWARSPFADTWDELTGLLIVVREGTVHADTIWLSTADQGGTLGTTSVSFIQLPGPTDIVAGAGLTRTAQTLDVGAGDGISVAADSITVNIDGSTLSKSGSGLKVAAAGITGTELNTSVAGNGLAGGGGSALSVNVDGSSIEINSDSLRVKAAGITDAMLALTYVQVSKYIVRETPTGAVNGSNVTFTLANTPVAGSEMVFLNGILQESGAGNDYTISGDTITYLTAPLTNDKIRVTYLDA